jgi:hypothetical protein
MTRASSPAAAVPIQKELISRPLLLTLIVRIVLIHLMFMAGIGLLVTVGRRTMPIDGACAALASGARQTLESIDDTTSKTTNE